MLHPYTSLPQKQIRWLKVRYGGQTSDYIFTRRCDSKDYFYSDQNLTLTLFQFQLKAIFLLPGHMIDYRKCHIQYVLWSHDTFVAEESDVFTLKLLNIIIHIHNTPSALQGSSSFYKIR